MASKRWIISAAVLLASSAVLPGPPAHGQVPPTVPTAPTTSASTDALANPQALVQRNLEDLDKRLNAPIPTTGFHDDSLLQAQREDAARRLLSRQSPPAVEYLKAALKAPQSRLAVVRAIIDAPNPDPAFKDPLKELLGGERTISDYAAHALARYGDDPAVRTLLIKFAQDLRQPANIRMGVIDALGTITSRDVTDALVAILNDPKQGPAAQNAAANALIAITGLASNRHDPKLWKDWQTATAKLADDVWRNEVLTAQNNRIAFERHAQMQLINELKIVIEENYQRADAAGKSAIMLRLLGASEPGTRVMGIQLLVDERQNARPTPDEAPKRLHDLVGDGDVAVRIEAASAIQRLSLTDALDALLTQVLQETSIEAKVAQIQALAPMKRLRAVPVLVKLLDDPSLQVAIEASRALQQMAQTILDQNPALAAQTADKLWQLGIARAGEPGGLEFRAATIEAVGELHDRRHLKDLFDLLNLQNPERIRSAALHALGSVGHAAPDFQIIQWLNMEPSAAVRIDALHALAKTSTFESAAATLNRFMGSDTEADPAVRDHAWLEFHELLKTATNTGVLTDWASKFDKDPERRLAVLQALNNRYRLDKQWGELALSQQNTGEVFMKLNDPASAIFEFEPALDYWQRQNVSNQVTIQLVGQLFDALLKAKNYDKATALGAKQIARDPTQQASIAVKFKDEVDRLTDQGMRANDQQVLNDALRLSQSVLKMQPPLDERFLREIRQYQQTIQQKLNAPGK